MKSEIDITFREAVQGLLDGDFSRLAPLFEISSTSALCPIMQWYESGLFDSEPKALEEAFTCACFNGCTDVIEYFLTRGVNPNGGINTGLNAFHWAADRGQLKAVEILIKNEADLETQNMYGGTVLGSVIWSAIDKLRPDHIQIIKALLEAGAQVRAVSYPSGNGQVDELLREYGARA